MLTTFGLPNGRMVIFIAQVWIDNDLTGHTEPYGYLMTRIQLNGHRAVHKH